MTQDIVGKLINHLSSPVSTEPNVVYLLCQVRKLLEKDDPGQTYGALWMCCHWALHVNLTKPSTTLDFLKRVDRWVSHTVAYCTPTSTWTVLEEFKLFEEFIYLATFRQQLAAFFKTKSLPTDLCDVDERWYEFLGAYSGVIQDGSITVKTNKLSELTTIKQVTFTKGPNLPAAHHVDFVIRWKIELQDGRTLKTDVETVPGGSGKMTAHNLEIINGNFVPPTPTPVQPSSN